MVGLELAHQNLPYYNTAMHVTHSIAREVIMLQILVYIMLLKPCIIHKNIYVTGFAKRGFTHASNFSTFT